ncbi:MAG: hypothetical protein AB7Q45_24500, partial [Planctomycetaceae bacterium]
MMQTGYQQGNSRGRWVATLVIVGAMLSGSSITLAADGDAALAKSLVERAGIQRGVCSVVTSNGDDLLPVEIARSSGLFVHVRCNDAATVERLRTAANDAKLGIDRIAVEQGSLGTLPYA